VTATLTETVVMTKAEVNAAMVEVHEVLGAPAWVRAAVIAGARVRLDRGWGHIEPSGAGYPPILVHCYGYLGDCVGRPHGEHRRWVAQSDWTATETPQPAAPEKHWLTRFDPGDGEPYGELCSCPHGDDHTIADLECTCAMTEGSLRSCARHGEDAPPE